MQSTNAKKPPLPTVYQMQKKWENKKPEKEAKYSVDINKRIVHSKDTVSAHINLSRSKLQIEIPNSESEVEQHAPGTLEYTVPPLESTMNDFRVDYGMPEGYEGPLTDLRQKVYRNDPPYSGYGGNLAFQYFKSKDLLQEAAAAGTTSRNTHSLLNYLSLQERVVAPNKSQKQRVTKEPASLKYAPPLERTLQPNVSVKDGIGQTSPAVGTYNP